MTKFVGLFIGVTVFIGCGTARGTGAPDLAKTFDGSSRDLKSTAVVPTLDTGVQEGQNAVWCASFLAAWKSLDREIAHGEILLDGSPQTAAALNAADDPAPNIPEGALYVASGWNDKGVIEKICRELKTGFPEKSPPAFPGIAPDSFLAYSYLEANVPFGLPYFQSRKPLEFTDTKGRKSQVSSFGIRPEDEYAYYQLRSQARVLFRKGSSFGSGFEFAVDLCANSSPSQIVVARINPEMSLAKALERIERGADELDKVREKDPGSAEYYEEIGPNDVLLVPDLCYQISHRFAELEGRRFLNASLTDQRIDVAQQDILFRLDRSGAELKSESKIEYLPIPTYFVLDRPFLIYMKKRGAAKPYFVMWIDNAELLTPWKR
ncbi:MAG: hypothetical protein RBU21_06575 [FCB group bacterium]|nr:hypothetical protein [FCB group bacterium]